MRFVVTAAIFCVIAVAACEVATALNSMTAVYENGSLVLPIRAKCQWCGHGDTITERDHAFFTSERCRRISCVSRSN